MDHSTGTTAATNIHNSHTRTPFLVWANYNIEMYVGVFQKYQINVVSTHTHYITPLNLDNSQASDPNCTETDKVNLH